MPHTEKSLLSRDIRDGLHDTIPIAVGYFAVALSLGIIGKQIGITWFQGFLSSCLSFSSTGGFAAFTIIGDNESLISMAVMTLVVNARYLLMGAALSQKIPENTPFWHRLLMCWGITDEIFGATIARKEPLRLPYSLAIMIPAVLGWGSGTAVGIIMGSILPERVVLAFGVALYGMFIAVFIPPAKGNKIVLGLVIVSFALSWACTRFAPFSSLSSGNRIILLTVVIAAIAAILFPVSDEEVAEDA